MSKNRTDAFQTKLRDFAKIRPGDTFVGLWIDECLEELKASGIKFPVKFCFDTEWYYADGTQWIAIPYYILDEKIVQARRRQKLITEGVKKAKFKRYLLHELGHMFEALYSTRKMQIRRKYFGASAKAPTSYLPLKPSKHYVENLPEQYAQSHPDEDFAETFAVYFAEKPSKWRAKYKDTPALNKLLCIGQLVEIAKTKKQRKLDSSSFSPLKSSKLIVKEELLSAPINIHHARPSQSTLYRLKNAYKISIKEAHYLGAYIRWQRSQKEKIDAKKILRHKAHYIPY